MDYWWGGCHSWGVGWGGANNENFVSPGGAGHCNIAPFGDLLWEVGTKAKWCEAACSADSAGAIFDESKGLPMVEQVGHRGVVPIPEGVWICCPFSKSSGKGEGRASGDQKRLGEACLPSFPMVSRKRGGLPGPGVVVKGRDNWGSLVGSA